MLAARDARPASCQTLGELKADTILWPNRAGMQDARLRYVAGGCLVKLGLDATSPGTT